MSAWKTATEDANGIPADFLLIGRSPCTNVTDAAAQNIAVAKAAYANRVNYFDGYTPLVDAETVDALDWVGDGTHGSDDMNSYRASLMLRALGFINFKNMYFGNNTYSPTLGFSRYLKFGYSNLADPIFYMYTNNYKFDAFVQLERWMRFYDQGESNEVFRISDAPSNASPHHIMGYVEWDDYGATPSYNAACMAGQMVYKGSYWYFCPAGNWTVRIGSSDQETSW